MPMRHVGKASRRVEARAGDEAQVVARRPPRIAAGDGEERVDAGLRAAGADARQALRDERPVDPVEAHDVGDGAERDEIEQRRRDWVARGPRNARARATRARVASST